MATIAMQRGSSAFSASTPITLWTQSGGSATKVMFNQLMMYNNAGNNLSGIFQLSYFPSGGFASQIAVLNVPTSQSSCQFDPVLGSKPQMIYNNSASYPGTQTGGQWMIANTGNSVPIGQSLNNSISITTVVFNSGYHVCPPSFYIGPGDIIKFQASTGSANHIVSWSFTTITE